MVITKFWNPWIGIPNYAPDTFFSLLSKFAEIVFHCGLKIGYVFWRVMHKTYMGHENSTKSVWETRFIQILGFPLWLKNTTEKLTSLQMCRIKKITPRTGQTFWDPQLCFYVKKYLLVKKHRKMNFVIFQWRFMSQILPRAHKFECARGKIWWHKSPMKNEKVHFSVFFH